MTQRERLRKEKEKRDANTWLAFSVLFGGLVCSVITGGKAYPAIFALVIALVLLYEV